MSGWLLEALAVAVPVVLAITLHEAAHGLAADKLGDPTAKQLGRLSLNPLRHVDPIGTVILPGALYFLSGMLFGWAKPVPVDVRRLHRPKRDMALVALAGPGANLLMGVLWAVVASLALVYHGSGAAFGGFLARMAWYGITINAVLMVLNLLPLPPLDGGRVLVSVLPPRAAMAVARVEPYGILVLLALLLTGVLGKFLWPAVHFASRGFAAAAGALLAPF